MEGTDEMMENNAIYALRRAIRALRDATLWMEGASEHHKAQAHLVKGHIEPLEGVLGAVIENRRRRRDGQ